MCHISICIEKRKKINKESPGLVSIEIRTTGRILMKFGTEVVLKGGSSPVPTYNPVERPAGPWKAKVLLSQHT